MDELLTVPIFFALIIGFSMQLIDIAQTTSAKASDFAQDMSDAMDCAMLGINISICSPNLMNYDFRPEAEMTLDALDAFKDKTAIYIDIDEFNASYS